MQSKGRENTPAPQFAALRRRNEYRARIAQLLEGRRVQRARIERVIDAQREHRLRHAR